MNSYILRDKIVQVLNYMADFDRIRIIYFMSLSLYFISKLLIENHLTAYDLIVILPGMSFAGYMLKYADESARKYGLVGYLILYASYYFIILLFITESIVIMLENIWDIDISYFGS